MSVGGNSVKGSSSYDFAVLNSATMFTYLPYSLYMSLKKAFEAYCD